MKKRFFIAYLAIIVLSVFCHKDLPTRSSEKKMLVFEQQGTIGNDGGLVQITDSNSPIRGAFVEIPENALESNTVIKILPSNNLAPNDDEAIVLKMEPAGLEFSKPIKLGLPYKSGITRPYDLQAYYFQSDSVIIQEMPIDTIDFNNKIVIANAIHFSEFFSGKHSVWADIEMLNISGRIGCKIRLFGKDINGNDVGFKYGIPLRLDVMLATSFLWAGQAFEEYFSAYGFKLNSLFSVALKEETLLRDSQRAIEFLFVSREEVTYNGHISTLWKKRTNGNTKILTTRWLDEYMRQKFYSGEPLIFKFNNFSPATNKRYYVEIEWATANHPDGFFLANLTPIYRFTNYLKNKNKYLSQMTVYNGDVNNNNLDDVFEDQVFSKNSNPTVPTLISPANKSINNAVLTQLKWSCSDPDNNPLTYDVYFSKSSNPSKISGDQILNNYTVGPLEKNTKYFWKIIAKDDEGATSESNVWEFTTIAIAGNTPPVASFEISPQSGTTSTDFHFNAEQSADLETPKSALQVRWDWDSNGWDTDYSIIKTATHRYTTAGTKTVKLEVKDAGDLLNSTSKIIVISEGTDPKESGTLSDIDGNIYKTVKIGNQWWMAENLKVTRYRNRDQIPNKTSDWGSFFSGAYCNYNYDEAFVPIYGRLYNWLAVDDSRGLAPEGWHIPSDEEWQTLINFLGGLSFAGGKMKATGNIQAGDGLWQSPNEGATNASCFSALPGGCRVYYGDTTAMGLFAYFWSSTTAGDGKPSIWSLSYNSVDATHSSTVKQSGISVRCIKD